MIVAALAACGGGSKSSRPAEAADTPDTGSIGEPGSTEPSGPTEPPPSKDPVDLPVQAPAVGDVAQIVETVESDGTMLAGGREVKLGRKGEVTRTEEVVAVDGASVTQLRVSYETVTDHRVVGSQEQDVTSPVAGQTFTVGVGKKGKHTLVDKDGKAVKGKLRDYILGELRDDIGAPTRFAAILGGKTYTSGEPVTVPAKDLVTVLPEGRDDLKGDPITVTYVERRGDIATFSLAGALSRPEGTMTLTLTFKGTLDIDVKTGRATKVAIDADTKGASKGTGGSELTGTWKGTKTIAAP
jgi:hypothetical protein